MIGLSDILRAQYRISSYIHNTPLMLSEPLSREVGCKVYVKLESLQKIGAFKVRGIYNKVLSTNETDRQKGFVTASSGNHGLGLAYVFRELQM